jgi:hypothetical protein
LWVYALLGLRRKPRFMRRATVVVPFFVLGHLLTGVIGEVRQMVPLGFVLIPSALWYLAPPTRADPDEVGLAPATEKVQGSPQPGRTEGAAAADCWSRPACA